MTASLHDREAGLDVSEAGICAGMGLPPQEARSPSEFQTVSRI